MNQIIKIVRLIPKIFKRVSFARIKYLFVYLKRDGISTTIKRFKECIYGTDVYQQEFIVQTVKHYETIDECSVINFKKKENPLVSIIIPVYNQFSFSYHCLKSIEALEDQTSYEIILADDASNDLTEQIGKVVKNIKIVRNERNLRFLLNCNHAAQFARGKYILFLNNDTQVQNGWLDSLVALLEKDDTIGMAGSKLVYADKRLQEAGGIIWNDGTAANYGNRQDPQEPEYNYVKEVDYISGASILIRSSLWKKIGGFDERYVPAYCEDSDLAFEVRRHGYKVVYQPLSVVIHFEGISNGTDTSCGLKKYQIDNQKKLYEKWSEELKNQQSPNTNLFHARERSSNKKTVLFIDKFAPAYDSDAGSKTVYQFLQMFVKKGFNVKFIGSLFYQREPYTTDVQQMGIEILYGEKAKKNIWNWLEENGQYIDYVFLNRPEVSEHYIDFLDKHKKFKVIYYGHDLSYMRLQREYEVTGDNSKRIEAEQWKEKELHLMRTADVSYYPSEIETQEIHRIDPSINVKTITAYAYENFQQSYSYEADQRNGLLFVGGFAHRPNEDAVIWFAKTIYPEIRKAISATFTIVGSSPSLAIKALEQEEGIIVKGFVSEEELKDLYQKTRIVVVPLRYGAGVKGKVVEAAYYGVPVVTTQVGAEGIPETDTFARIADAETDFAKAVIELYQSEEELRQKAQNSQKLVKKYFSMDTVWDVMKEDFV